MQQPRENGTAVSQGKVEGRGYPAVGDVFEVNDKKRENWEHREKFKHISHGSTQNLYDRALGNNSFLVFTDWT